MLKHFSNIWTIKGTTLDQKTEAYYEGLKKYSIKDITKGGQRCLDTCKGFPIPKEIVEAMDLNEFTKEDYRISYKMKCGRCYKIGLGIEEPINSHRWLCRQCYTGLTSKQIAGRFNDLFLMMENKGYRPEWLKQIEEG